MRPDAAPFSIACAVAIAACSGGAEPSSKAGPGPGAGDSAARDGQGSDAGAGGTGSDSGSSTRGTSPSGTPSTTGSSSNRASANGSDGGDAVSPGGGPADPSRPTVGKLFWLAIVGNQVESASDTGAGARTLASGMGIEAPDGIAVDVAGGKMYWTNMGTLTDGPHTPNGSLQRANLDGSGIEVIVKPAATNTPKQTAARSRPPQDLLERPRGGEGVAREPRRLGRGGAPQRSRHPAARGHGARRAARAVLRERSLRQERLAGELRHAERAERLERAPTSRRW